jgi:transcriptional regulator with PAS, ATPase and Fis domain
LRESFLDATKGLGADKSILVRVCSRNPLELDTLYAAGLSPEDEAAWRAPAGSPGIAASLIRRAIEDVAQSWPSSGLIGLDEETPRPGQADGFLCAPVKDALTGDVAAVVCFHSEAGSAFEMEEVGWLTAYAEAVGQTLIRHLCGQGRIPDLEPEWRRVHDPEGPEIVGDSEATKRLGETLNALLPSTTRPDAPVFLVTGESGTGKELVARYLHHYSRKRRHGPFQAFNCAGLRGELAEAKLFGHTRGAFTGAIADAPGLFRGANNGVLLLDEVGELPAEGQALLLRVLETRAVQPVGSTKEFYVDVQVVVATNRKLEDEVAAGRFREDLYYRLDGLQVELLPLRDPRRLADVRAMLGYYLARHEHALRKRTMGLTRDALRVLLQFSWPGNVRQLSNVCLRLVTHALPGAWIEVADIRRLQPDVLSGPHNPNPVGCTDDEDATYSDALREFRKKLILGRLSKHSNNVVDAAASLKISGSTFYRYWSVAKQHR